MCSGAFVLAQAGLLDGRRATTHWRHLERLRIGFPQVAIDPDVLYVADGCVITSAGSAAGLDMLLHVVRTDYGADIANKVAQRLVIPAHRDGDQQQLVVRPLPDGDANPIAPMMDWIREHIRSRHTVATMAARARMGTRTFQRRFKESTGVAPLAWLVRERIHLAARLLETHPALGIDAVADLAGLGSAESLRRHFRTHGLPSSGRYRRRGAGAT
jgi:AraC family transcriptional activator FtrA